jgi:DivIVA domain-containing protein
VRRKDKEQAAGTEVGSAAPSTASAMMTPLDIQQKEFQVSRLGGYRMRDVDEFLDQLTDAMTAVLAENERLRSGASGPPILGSPDLDEVGRQADEIIQRARDEAARIVADAREQAASAAMPGPSGSVTPAQREAVDAFLAREREFLQSLAALVQEHADGVKGMAREIRRRGTQPAAPPAPVAAERPVAASRPSREPAPTASSPPPVAPPEPTSPASLETTPPPRAPEARIAQPPRDPEPTRPIGPVGPTDDPIVVAEPEPARTRGGDEGGDAERGDESLRELFWGEEG